MTKNLEKAHAAAGLTLAISSGGLGGTSSAAQSWFSCDPIEVTVFAERMHIKCRHSYVESGGLGGLLPLFGDPRFFAVPASNERMTIAATALVQAAITSDRPIQIDFDYFDNSGESYGCLLADCRPILALRLRE